MPDPADAVHWSGGPGEAAAAGTGAPDVTEAAQWLAVASDASEEERDLALMAWLGPGSCLELGTIVTGPAPVGGETDRQGVSLARALELAPTVAAHVTDCEACSDRLRAMVSVGEVLRHGRPPTPGQARLLHPTGGAAGREPGSRTRDRRRRPSGPPAAAAALAAIGVAAAIAYLAWPSASPGPTSARSTAAAISQLPAGGSSLVLDPASTSTAVLHLSDVGPRGVTWQAATTAPWLRVAPATGHLQPGQSVSLALDIVGNQASGLRATVTVNGNDGSVAAASYRP
ncbi:MAG TPA: hypothetical protein VFH58_09205 [Acidimicrobiales bacterium]|nr:hypothetical protein [Acidimicrobiales bacterium]